MTFRRSLLAAAMAVGAGLGLTSALPAAAQTKGQPIESSSGWA